MKTENENRAKFAEIQKLLEEVTGRPLSANPEQLAGLTAPIASSTYISVPYDELDAWVTNESFVPAGPGISGEQARLSSLSASDSSLLDTAGLVTTGADGQISFKLSTFVNWRDGVSRFLEPVNIVATAQSGSPCLVTVGHRMVPNPVFQDLLWNYADVLITAYAWTLAGEPAPGVGVYWRCRAVATEPIRQFPAKSS